MSSTSQSLLPSVFQEDSACAGICPQLTYTQRIIGFFSCGALGWILSLVGSLTLINGFSDENIRIFIFLYVSGNVIALMATGFLLGPKSQCNKMWHPCRRFTTAFYLIMLIVVFVVAIEKLSIYLILFLLFVEICAALWYSISYIPGGRTIALSVMRSTGLCFPCFFVYDQAVEAAKPKQTSMFGNSK